MAECGAKLTLPPSTQVQFSAIPRKRRKSISNQLHPLQSRPKRQWWNLVKAFQSIEEKKEIRVCVNKSCSKNGSRETLQFLTGLAPPDVIVKSCGCLGRCGSGPNLVVLPAEVLVSHCTTALQAACLLAAQCGAADPENNLNALSLREVGNKEFECGNAAQAEQLYSQAIDLKPSGGQHLLYANRSAARLAIGDNVGSLLDAEEALRMASNWHVAYVRQGDAYCVLGDYQAAEHAYIRALAIEPSLRRSKSFKAQIQKLKEKLALSNVSS